jgi:hypothetical protein
LENVCEGMNDFKIAKDANGNKYWKRVCNLFSVFSVVCMC